MKTTEGDRARAAWTDADRAAAQGGALTREASAGSPAAAAAAVQAPPLDPDAEPRANLWRYATWQIRDFVRERGGWILALGGAALAIFRTKYDPSWLERIGSGYHPSVNGHLMTEADYFRQQLANTLGSIGFLGAFIASHSLVSRDRERGFQRFLFAKPLRPTRYYLQSFLVNGAGYVGTIGLLLVLAAATFLRGVPMLGGLAVAAGAYAAFGGFVFLLSTVVRYDAGLAIFATMAGLAAQGAARDRGAPWAPLFWAVGKLVPPFTWVADALSAAAQGRTLDAMLASLPPIAYGAACVAAGLAILRRRSIAN